MACSECTEQDTSFQTKPSSPHLHRTATGRAAAGRPACEPAAPRGRAPASHRHAAAPVDEHRPAALRAAAGTAKGAPGPTAAAAVVL